MLDASIDIYDHFKFSLHYTAFELIHLISEFGAVVILGAALYLLNEYLVMLEESNKEARLSFKALRETFDDHVFEQFDKWNFTAAEKDVAILLLRGLTISEIAQLRETSNGTVKVQSHNIFRKSDVSSRVEFMAIFIDEFMDLGLN